jgi:NAD(P)-dependent dehydrogenase (short-subunit alcohol dehydrogenase family)
MLRGQANSGVSGSFKSFLDATPSDIANVTRTNLLGALLCTRAAIKVMEHQERIGHVFNMDGAGAFQALHCSIASLLQALSDVTSP